MFQENTDLKLEFESYGIFENDVQFIKDLIYTDVFKSKVNDNLSFEEKVSLFIFSILGMLLLFLSKKAAYLKPKKLKLIKNCLKFKALQIGFSKKKRIGKELHARGKL